MNLIIRLLVNSLSLLIVSRLIPGVYLENLKTAIIASIVIGCINVMIKPVLTFFTLPLTLLTLGLFTFIINAMLLLLASALTPGFRIDGFFTAIIASIALSFISTILHSITQ